MHNGLPWGTLPLSLCSGPCPPVDGYRNEEVNTSPPEVAIPGDICKINGLFPLFPCLPSSVLYKRH